MTLIEAVQKANATSADYAPEEGTLLERVERHLEAQEELEQLLQDTFSADELEKLKDALANKHGQLCPHCGEYVEAAMTMQLNTNEQDWYQAYLDTPLSIPEDRVREAHRRRDPDHLIDVPGVSLKSKERETGPGRGWPKHHGKLVSYGETVVVRGHGSAVSPKVVWTGTVSEYLAMWEVD